MRLFALLVLLSIVLACRSEDSPPTEGWQPSGITIYDPKAAWNGFTLALYRGQHPVLIDMYGRTVRSWPEMRVKSRARLTPECTVIAINRGRGIVEHDWNDSKIWSASFEDRYPHHDLVRLDNGHTLLLTRAKDSPADDVVELDREGKTVWTWRSGEWLAPYIEARGNRQRHDPTHLNSVHALPANPWFDTGDERFRPGNVLLSARSLNLVLIVDKRTGEVVWTYRVDLSLQHEALMIRREIDPDRAGNIMIFNNRYGSFRTDRQSEVIEIRPTDGAVVWSYSTPGFYSATSGSQQPLPNGNVLINSSTAGRSFEVDRSGRIVWEWVPAFKLDRPNRYAVDHCPRLAELGPPDGPPIRPPAGYFHIDRETYRFSRERHRTRASVDGVKRTVLRPDYRCAPLLIPPGAQVTLKYGINRSRATALGLEGYAATFSLTLTNPEGGSATVFEDRVGFEGPAWRKSTVRLDALARRRVEMCVELDEEGLGEAVEPGTLAFWGSPTVAAADELEEEAGLEGQTDLTPEEREVQLEHLRAMGYVN